MRLLRYSMTILLLTAICAIAKDYQTFYSNQTALFSRYFNSDIQCVRIDSVKFQADSVFYPYAVIQENEPSNDCQFSKLASWIGKSVTISENGMNTFVNRAGDSIRINTKAALGEKWIAYQIPDSITIEASITQFDTLSFLGIKDSVKTITFKAFDKDMNPLDYRINNMKLQLSKNYGIVTMLNFYYFPNSMGSYGFNLQEYTLIGLTNPEVGVQNLTWADVYDFQVGDELHISTHASCIESDNTGISSTQKDIIKYIERKDFSDSIVYKYARLTSIVTNTYTHEGPIGKYEYFNDTLSLLITRNDNFDKLPGEVIINNDEQNQLYKYYFRTETLLSNSHLCKIEPNWSDRYFKRNDTCLGLVIGDGCLADQIYYKDLGGPYYYCTEWLCLGLNKRELVYYKKGDVTYGTKLEVVSKVDTKDIENIKIFPNPAFDKISISIPDFSINDFTATLYDVLGNVVKQSKIKGTDSNISIEDIGSGIYMLILSNNHGVIKSEKIIIE